MLNRANTELGKNCENGDESTYEGMQRAGEKWISTVLLLWSNLG